MSAELQPQIDQNRVILGGSTSTPPGEGEWFDRYLRYAKRDIEPLVSGKHVVLIPYANSDMAGLLRGGSMRLREMGARTVFATNQYPGAEQVVIADAEAIYIEGGITGRLVSDLHALRNYDGSFVDTREDASQTPLVDVIRRKAALGTPVIGFSAGLNVMGADTRTTNDMPAAVVKVSPDLALARLDSIGLFPSNLNFNPHYPKQLENKAEYTGENRAEKIQQVLEMDPWRRVLALREGAYVLANGMKMTLEGTMGAVLFEAGKTPQELENGDKACIEAADKAGIPMVFTSHRAFWH